MGSMEDSTMPTSQSAIRDDVTTRIIQALESNLLPWRRPWRTDCGREPARQALERRKPEAIPGREPPLA